MNDYLQQFLVFWDQLATWVGTSEWGLTIVVGVIGTTLLWAAVRLMFQSPPEQSHLPAVIDDEADPGVFGSLTEGLAAQIPESEAEADEFAQMLRQAGLYSPSDRGSIYALRFVLLFLPLAVAGILMAVYPFEYTLRILIIGALTAGVLSIVPRFYVYLLRNARQREIRDGLSDMMDMLSMCLSGGLPLSESLDHVAKNLASYPALAQELQILRRQTDVGSLKHALADFASRIDLPEVRQLSSMLSRGDHLGMRLSENLGDQAEHFRASRRQTAVEQANEAPVKMVLPLMICFAPAALLMLISPAMMELRDFIYPSNQENSVLAGNELLDPTSINRTLDELNQDVSGQNGNGRSAPSRPQRSQPAAGEASRSGTPAPGRLVAPPPTLPRIGGGRSGD